MPRYRIKVTWTEAQTVEIELEDEAAARAFTSDMDLDKGEYVCDSFEIQSIEEIGDTQWPRSISPHRA